MCEYSVVATLTKWHKVQQVKLRDQVHNLSFLQQVNLPEKAIAGGEWKKMPREKKGNLV